MTHPAAMRVPVRNGDAHSPAEHDDDYRWDPVVAPTTWPRVETAEWFGRGWMRLDAVDIHVGGGEGPDRRVLVRAAVLAGSR